MKIPSSSSSQPSGCGRHGAVHRVLRLSAPVLLIAASALHAQTVFDWNGGTGSWTTGANWSTGTVPNSSSADVLIDNGDAVNSAVTLRNAGATFGRLTIDAGDSLTFDNTSSPAQQFALIVAQGAFAGSGTILNNGTFNVTAGVGRPMILQLGNSNAAETVTLNGTGTLILGDSLVNQITTSNTLLTFVNNSTITGAGTVGNNVRELRNTGIITATSSTNRLLVQAGKIITNTGTLRAGPGATLTIEGTTGTMAEALSNVGGVIEADGPGAVVALGASRVRGGTLTTRNGGVIYLIANNMNLDGSTSPITISAGSDVRIQNGFAPDAKGTLIIDGTLTLDTGGVARLQVIDLFVGGAQSLTLSGAGSVIMTNQAGNEINGTSGSSLTTNIPITGSGKFTSLNITNNSAITANGSAGLAIYPFATFTNNATGIVRSSGSGGVTLNPGSYTNNGLFEANGGNITGMSTASFTNYNATTDTLTGGTWRVIGPRTMALAAIGPVVINSANVELSGLGSTFTPINSLANNQGSFTLRNDRNFTTAGSLTNSGTLRVDGTAALTINGNLALSASSHLSMIIGRPNGLFDRVTVTATATFGGQLEVTLLAGFTPAPSDSYIVLTAGSPIAGAFSNLVSGGRLQTSDGRGSFIATYNGNNLVLSNFQPAPPGALLNISTRLRLPTGENVLIGGFIITGTEAKKVIIRGIGPSLAQFFAGALADPTLELFQGNTLLENNDNWHDNNRAAIEATGIPPSNDLESAIVRTLPPGAYTAILRGKGGTAGIAVVEAYDLNQAANSKLANIATRGFVGTGNNVMIGGFIVGPGGSPTRVIVRGLGPSLASSGVTGALQDPTLELHDGNGALLASNDNWKDSQRSEIEATTIPPRDDRESAIVSSLFPGAYTSILRGKDNTTGVGLVEVYNLP